MDNLQRITARALTRREPTPDERPWPTYSLQCVICRFGVQINTDQPAQEVANHLHHGGWTQAESPRGLIHPYCPACARAADFAAAAYAALEAARLSE